MNRKFVRSALAAAATLVGVAISVVGVSAPANAATATCTDGYACIWQDQDFVTNGHQSQWVRIGTYSATLSAHDYAGTTHNSDNSATSTQNNDNVYNAYYFQLDYCGGYVFAKNTNTTDSDFTNGTPEYSDGSSANDRTSAIAFSNYIGTCG